MCYGNERRIPSEEKIVETRTVEQKRFEERKKGNEVEERNAGERVIERTREGRGLEGRNAVFPEEGKGVEGRTVGAPSYAETTLEEPSSLIGKA